MKMAFREAEKAFEAEEVPIGAIIVKDDKVVGRGYNQTETLKDGTAHAEMIAITSAASFLNGLAQVRSKLLEDKQLVEFSSD